LFEQPISICKWMRREDSWLSRLCLTTGFAKLYLLLIS
jgi:hypothetical protein